MTNVEFALFCENALKKETYYMWGCFGQRITKALISQKSIQYPRNFSSTRVSYLEKLINHDGISNAIGCDCAGLIKWFLWTDGDIEKAPFYNEKTDRGTAGLYRDAKEKGLIGTLPEMKGVIVYKDGHVGVYMGDGNVIECTLGSRGDGVVRSKLNAAGWTHWLKVPEITYVEQPKEEQPKKEPVITATKKIPQFVNKIKNLFTNIDK